MKRIFIIAVLLLSISSLSYASDIKDAKAFDWLSKKEPTYSFINDKIKNEESYISSDIKIRFCNSVTLFVGHSMLVQAYEFIPDGIDVIAIGGANTWKMSELLSCLREDIGYSRIIVWSMINDFGIGIDSFTREKLNNVKKSYDATILEARKRIKKGSGGSIYLVKECMRGDKPFLDEYIYNMNRYIDEEYGINSLEQKYYLDEEHSKDGVHYDKKYREEVFKSFLDQIIQQEKGR